MLGRLDSHDSLCRTLTDTADCIRELGAWLNERRISTLFVGALDDVREAHWSAEVHEKTDLFWAHGRFRRRLREVLEGEFGIALEEASEAGTSSHCPACTSADVSRHGDLLQCHGCEFEGHSDIAGLGNFLAKQAAVAIELTTDRPRWAMARPGASREHPTEDGQPDCGVPYLEWDDHEWRRSGHPFETKQVSTHRSTRRGILPRVAQAQPDSPTRRNPTAFSRGRKSTVV